jgi:small ligand-binding sensory domain FIST
MLQVAVGHSNEPDSRYAVDEVLEQCRSKLDGNQPQAGILFAAINIAKKNSNVLNLNRYS